MWYNLAAVSYSTSDPDFIEGAAMVRMKVARNMTPDQRAEARKMAREWRPQKVKNSLPENWLDPMLR